MEEGAATLTLAGCGQTEPKPNIILIMTDQQRADTIGALGAPWMRTPHLDRMAAEGMRVDLDDIVVTTGGQQVLDLDITEGETVRVEKIVSFFTSHDNAITETLTAAGRVLYDRTAEEGR